MDSDKGTYVSVKFTKETNIRLAYLQKYIQSLNVKSLKNPTPMDEFHTTIVYTRNVIPYRNTKNEPLSPLTTYVNIEVWDTPNGKYIVAVYNSKYLKNRHEYGKAIGATYDYDEYKPHVTLFTDVHEDVKVPNLPMDIIIEFEREIIEELRLDEK